ncbi:MAG: hypothetical protein JMDDDDMK_02646 [Acidobacteria bacterium]|nr:hypothetical protein [Acidobacteriota bacterium]
MFCFGDFANQQDHFGRHRAADLDLLQPFAGFQQFLQTVFSAGFVSAVDFDHQLMPMLALLRTGGEIRMEFARDFAVKLFEFVGMKTILAAADFIVGQRPRLFVFDIKPLQLCDLFLDLGQFVVTLADQVQVTALERAQAGLQIRKLRLVFGKRGFEFGKLFAFLQQRLLFAQLTWNQSRCAHSFRSKSALQLFQYLGERLVFVAIDPALAAIFGQRMFGEDFIRDFRRRSIRQSVTYEDDVFATPTRFFQMSRLVVTPMRFIAEFALPAKLFVGTNAVRQNFNVRELVARNEQINELMEAGAQNGQRNFPALDPAGKLNKSSVNPNPFAQQVHGVAERSADAAHFGDGRVAQAHSAFNDQTPDGFDHLSAAAKMCRQKNQRVFFGDRAVEVGKDVKFCHS